MLMLNADWSFPDFTYDFRLGRLGSRGYRASTIINECNQSENIIYAGHVPQDFSSVVSVQFSKII